MDHNGLTFPVELVGNKIRELRKTMGLTVEELADKAGISQSMISQVERGLAKPSIDTLWKLSIYLDVPLFAFFEDIHREPILITRAENQKMITMSHSNVRYQLLAPSVGRKIEFFKLIVEPYQKKDQPLLAHKGEECGLVIQGEFEVIIENKSYHLRTGDSIYFDSTLPHCFYNPGEEVAIGVWAMTPPDNLNKY